MALVQFTCDSYLDPQRLLEIGSCIANKVHRASWGGWTHCTSHGGVADKIVPLQPLMCCRLQAHDEGFYKAGFFKSQIAKHKIGARWPASAAIFKTKNSNDPFSSYHRVILNAEAAEPLSQSSIPTPCPCRCWGQSQRRSHPHLALIAGVPQTFNVEP